MVAHTYYPDTQEAETGLLKVKCQPELHNENQASLGYTTMRDSCFCPSLCHAHTKKKEVEEKEGGESLCMGTNLCLDRNKGLRDTQKKPLEILHYKEITNV